MINIGVRRVMRKPDFCSSVKTKAHISTRAADQQPCFRYMDSIIPLLPKPEIFKYLAIVSGCTTRFVSDLVGNPEYRFCSDVALENLFTMLTFAVGDGIKVLQMTSDP